MSSENKRKGDYFHEQQNAGKNSKRAREYLFQRMEEKAMMEKPRHGWAKVIYDGKDITDVVTAGLLSLKYTDNIDKADLLDISVEDVDGN